MNNLQLDCALVYLNEGRTIDPISFLSESIYNEIDDFNFFMESISLNEGIDMKGKIKSLIEKIKTIWKKIIAFIKDIKDKINAKIRKFKSSDNALIIKSKALVNKLKAVKSKEDVKKESVDIITESGELTFKFYGQAFSDYIPSSDIRDIIFMEKTIVGKIVNQYSDYCGKVVSCNYNYDKIKADFVTLYNSSINATKSNASSNGGWNGIEENAKSALEYLSISEINKEARSTRDAAYALSGNLEDLECINNMIEMLSNCSEDSIKKINATTEKITSELVNDRDKFENVGETDKMRFCEQALFDIGKFSSALSNALMTNCFNYNNQLVAKLSSCHDLVAATIAENNDKIDKELERIRNS